MGINQSLHSYPLGQSLINRTYESVKSICLEWDAYNKKFSIIEWTDNILDTISTPNINGNYRILIEYPIRIAIKNVFYKYIDGKYHLKLCCRIIDNIRLNQINKYMFNNNNNEWKIKSIVDLNRSTNSSILRVKDNNYITTKNLFVILDSNLLLVDYNDTDWYIGKEYTATIYNTYFREIKT